MTSSFDMTAEAQDAAKRNLWLHFTRMGAYSGSDVPVIVRGSGAYVFDTRGRRYLDGLSGLFVSQVGHFDEIEQILRAVLTEAGKRIQHYSSGRAM